MSPLVSPPVSLSSFLKTFVLAVGRGDDATAIILVERGLVASTAIVGPAHGVACDDRPQVMLLLFSAIRLHHPAGVTALVRAGARPNDYVFQTLGEGGGISGSVTAACACICFGLAPMLLDVHALSATIDGAFRLRPEAAVVSGVVFAFANLSHSCLECLLDARPLAVSPDLAAAVASVGVDGAAALVVYRVLFERRLFDFKMLETIDHQLVRP